MDPEDELCAEQGQGMMSTGELRETTITGVEVEAERRHVAIELELCGRYMQRTVSGMTEAGNFVGPYR